MDVKEALAEVRGAFVGVTSTEVLMETSVQAFMEGMEDMKASSKSTSTEDFMGASAIFRESFYGSNFHEGFH